MKTFVNCSRKFVVAIDRYCASLPQDPVFQISGDQLRKASITVYSYAEAAQSETSYEKFVARMAIVKEEVEETMFWLRRVETIWPEVKQSPRTPELLAHTTALRECLSDAWKYAPEPLT